MFENLIDKISRFNTLLGLRFLYLWLLMVFSFSVDGQQWTRYQSPNLDFTISCPGGIMKYDSKTIITGIGKLVNQVHYLDIKEDHPNFLYSVNVVQYPEGSFDKDSIGMISELFEATTSALAESTGCSISYSQQNLDSNEPYVIVRLHDAHSDTAIKSKVFLINDTVYSIQVYTNHDNKLNDFIDKFINSFKVNIN